MAKQKDKMITAMQELIALALPDNRAMNNPLTGIYSESELALLLGVSRSTLRKWRRERILGYSLIGRQVYYTIEDVRRVMKDFHKETFSENPFWRNK